jgi:hypothetical protein
VTAVQVPNWTGEGLRVRARHALALDPRLARALFAVGRADHGVRKLLSGGYRRQAAVRRRLRGADLRWFASAEARRNAEQLLRIASHHRRGS